MSEEMISRREFLAGVCATLGLATVAAIAVAPMTASATSVPGKTVAACSQCHVEAPCAKDCATCPQAKKATPKGKK
jgi:hypothetical protein